MGQEGRSRARLAALGMPVPRPSSRLQTGGGDPAHAEGAGVHAVLVLSLATFCALAAHCVRAPTGQGRAATSWRHMNTNQLLAVSPKFTRSACQGHTDM